MNLETTDPKTWKLMRSIVDSAKAEAFEEAAATVEKMFNDWNITADINSCPTVSDFCDAIRELKVKP